MAGSARRRGLGITEAIKVAVKEANRSSEVGVADLERRIAPILEKVRALRKTTGPHDDKAFMDEMWGEEP